MNVSFFKQSVVTLGMVTPVTGPRPFNYEAVLLFNWRFGRSRRRCPTDRWRLRIAGGMLGKCDKRGLGGGNREPVAAAGCALIAIESLFPYLALVARRIGPAGVDRPTSTRPREIADLPTR